MARTKIKKESFKAWCQILVLIVSTIAISYLMGESSATDEIKAVNQDEINLSLPLMILRIINSILWNKKTLASAADIGIQTCMKTKDGRDCAEYPPKEEVLEEYVQRAPNTFVLCAPRSETTTRQ